MGLIQNNETQETKLTDIVTIASMSPSIVVIATVTMVVWNVVPELGIVHNLLTALKVRAPGLWFHRAHWACMDQGLDLPELCEMSESFCCITQSYWLVRRIIE